MSWNALALQSINPLSDSELFSYTGKTLKISGTSCTRGMKTESTCRWNWQNITWSIIVKGEDYLWVNVSGSKLSIAFEKNITWNDQWNFLLKLQGIEQDGFDIKVVHFYLHIYVPRKNWQYVVYISPLYVTSSPILYKTKDGAYRISRNSSRIILPFLLFWKAIEFKTLMNNSMYLSDQVVNYTGTGNILWVT